MPLSTETARIVSTRGHLTGWAIAGGAVAATLAAEFAMAFGAHEVFPAPSLVAIALITFSVGLRTGLISALLFPVVAYFISVPIDLAEHQWGAWLRIGLFVPLGLLTVLWAETLARTLEKSMGLAEMRRELLSIAVHQLASPLTSIYGFASLLRRRLRDDPDALRHLELLLSQARSMRTTLDLFVNVARVEGMAIIPRPEDIDLEPLVDEAMAVARLNYPTAKYWRAVGSAPTRIRCDRDVLMHILQNLLDNAGKYAGEEPLVTVAVDVLPHQVRITVSDNGPGVPSDEKLVIFERFNRGSTARGSGSGLGLYVAAELARSLGGQIFIGDSISGGAAFTLLLPRTAPEVVAEVSESHPTAMRA